MTSHVLKRARLAVAAAALAVLIPGVALGNSAPPPESSSLPTVATPAPTETPASPEARAKALELKDSDIGIGDPNAPVKWIEYASAGCPHCAVLTLKVLPELKAAYIDSGKVYYVLRDFPLDNVAAAASIIARCLPKEQFYPFMDKLFANQDKWHGPGVTDAGPPLKALAAEVGLDGAGVDACLKRQEILTQIVAIVEEADATLKVASTPSSFINGELIVGAAPPADFKAAFDKALGDEAPGGMTPVPETTPEQSVPATP